MPIKCAACGGTGKKAATKDEGDSRCPGCKGCGETLTPLERRIGLSVLAAIFVLSFLFVWVLRHTGAQ